jgi:Tfp pilus assembly protein PilF
MNGKGLALSNMGKHEDAIVWYDRALAVDGKYTDVMINKGVALTNQGSPVQVIVWFEKVLSEIVGKNDTEKTHTKIVKSNMKNKTIYSKIMSIMDKINTVFNKAYVLGMGLKEYDRALNLTETYLETYPLHRGLLCTTAEIYRETGNEKIAETFQEQLKKLSPNYQCGLI